MIIRLIQTTIIAFVMLCSQATVDAQSNKADTLKPYTSCNVPGDLKIKQVTRRSAGDNYREVTTDNGKQKVSVVDGDRVMFAYPDLTYYFANVKIEQSAPESYAAASRFIRSRPRTNLQINNFRLLKPETLMQSSEFFRGVRGSLH